MAKPFEIALTADFLRPDGKPAYASMGLEQIDGSGGRAAYRYFDAHAPEMTSAQIANVDAVLCLTPRVTRQTLQGAARLRHIARFGVGYDSVDVPACTEAGVAVTITKGAVNFSVAESIVAFMLALCHRVPDKDRLVRQDRWAERSLFMGSELRRKTAGLVGLGGIGKQTVKLIASFGMARPLAFDPYLDAAEIELAGARKVDLPTLLREADFAIMACPLSDETRNLIGAAELQLMKPSAYVINTARGGIVNESDLEAALRTNRIAGAALDVFEKEPTDGSLPFSKLDNVILSPHSIAVTHELAEEVGRMACRQILELAEGRKPDGLLNPDVWNHPGFRKKMGLG